MSFNRINGLWFLHDSFTVQQAAALIAGFDPNTVRWNVNGGAWFESEHGLTESEGISCVSTTFSALVNAINGGTLAATLRRTAWERGWNEELSDLENDHSFERSIELSENDNWPTERTGYIKNRGVVFRVTPDWSLTTVLRTDLVNWLRSRGMRDGFFFPDATTNTPGYLDPGNPRYSFKLAATVSAWLAVTEAIPKKSEKQSLEIWLRANAGRFELVDEDGNPKAMAMTECATVANWRTTGGATPTPGA